MPAGYFAVEHDRQMEGNLFLTYCYYMPVIRVLEVFKNDAFYINGLFFNRLRTLLCAYGKYTQKQQRQYVK